MSGLAGKLSVRLRYVCQEPNRCAQFISYHIKCVKPMWNWHIYSFQIILSFKKVEYIYLNW